MDYYSDIARGYEELHGDEQDRKVRAFLGRVVLKRGGALLDVGCATGRSALLFDEVEWHGIEPAAGLISQARPEVRHRILQAKAEKLPFPDASFDAILCCTVLQNVDDPRAALAEMRRVCKEGGVLMVSLLKRSPKAKELDALVRAVLRVREEWEETHDMMYVCLKA